MIRGPEGPAASIAARDGGRASTRGTPPASRSVRRRPRARLAWARRPGRLGESGERRPPGVRPALAAGLDPSLYRVRVGPGLAAQHRGLAGERLVQLALARALKDPGDLGQEVGPSARELPELGHRGGLFLAAQLAPPRPVPRLAVELGDEQAVSLRALIDHEF